jgi:hypothetical protein
VADGGTGVSTSTGTTNVVLSNSPTIVTPVIAQINDANGNETLKLASIASAVNEISIENAATGNPVHIRATGGDASVGLHLVAKGASGYVNVTDGVDETKRLMFNASGGTTNTRTMLSSTQTVDRTISLPDATGTLLYGGGPLGTPSSGTVTNLTGTASININGTVGATTPSTGAFTTLSATGNLTLNNTQLLQFKDSTGSVNSYIHATAADVFRIQHSSANKNIFVTVNGAAGAIQFGEQAGTVYGSFSSTGLAVTGTLSTTSNVTIGAGSSLTLVSGDIKFSSNAGYGILSADTTRVLAVTNAGIAVAGALSATGTISTSAGAVNLTDTYTVNWANGNSYVQGSVAGGYVRIGAAGSVVGAFSSTGLAVTGALSATGRCLIGTTTGVGNDFTSIRFNSSGSYPQGLNMVDAYASASGSVFQVFRKSDDTYLGNIRRSGTDNAIYVGGNSYLALGSGDTERMRIDSSGNVGIGTTPSAWQNGGNLQLSGANVFSNIGITYGANAYYNAGWKYITTGYGASYQNLLNGQHQFFTSTGTGTAGNAITFTQAMTLDASGNLGIGTTSPSYKLHVVDNSNGFHLTAGITGTGDSGAVLGLQGNGSNPNKYLRAYNGNFQILNSAISTAILDLTDGGALSVTGAATLSSTSNTVLMVGTSTSDANYRVRIDGGGGAALRTDTTADSTVIGFFRSGTNVGTISVTTTATAYNTSSDYRLKDITGSLTDSGSFIDALKPKVGTWKADGSKFVGFLAHEFAEVSPSSVTGEKDAVDADGKPVYQSMQASSAEVIANLVAELQSLRQRVAALESN